MKKKEVKKVVKKVIKKKITPPIEVAPIQSDEAPELIERRRVREAKG